MDDLVAKLFEIKAIKFGSFTLKSGLVSPIYFDLRVIISYPSVLETVARLLWEKCSKSSVELICGVPYTALPIASVMSVRSHIPMVLRRKEQKDYGTKKLIEGDFLPGQNCLIVEDVVTTGGSIIETAVELEKVGLVVTDAVVLLDRGQGGLENLAKQGITMHPLFEIDNFMSTLEAQGLVGKDVVRSVMDFVRGAKQQVVTKKHPRLVATLEHRLEHTKHPVSSRLIELMIAKQSNLCVAADLVNLDQVISLADKIGPMIIVLKIHVDIFSDFDMPKIQQLKDLSIKHNFLIMEDRKFADISNTVQLQLHGGVYNISQWADAITVHPLPGPEMVTNMNAAKPGRNNCGSVLILEMSSRKALTSDNYVKEVMSWGSDVLDNVVGFVGQSPIEDEPLGWIQFSPGVNMISTGDGKGQQYSSPEEAILNKGADIIIVGRGLIESSDLIASAAMYRGLIGHWQ